MCAGSPLPVLVADDQALMRWAMGRTLETLGFRPVFAASCGEALAEIDCQPFAMAVLAESIEGQATTCLVQALQQHGVFRIVVLAESGASVARLRPGPVVVMEKPFSLDSVISAIRALAAETP